MKRDWKSYRFLVLPLGAKVLGQPFALAVICHLVLRLCLSADLSPSKSVVPILASSFVALLGGASGLFLKTSPLLALEILLLTSSGTVALSANHWIRSGDVYRLGSVDLITPIELASLASLCVIHGQGVLAHARPTTGELRLAVAGFLIGIPVLALTLTRSALAGCIVLCLAIGRGNAKAVRLMVIPAICAVFLCLRMGGPTNFVSSSDSAVSRLTIWRAAGSQALASWPRGLGVDGFNLSIVTSSGGTTNEQILDNPKSSYLLPVVDFGLAGALISALMVAGALMNFARFLGSKSSASASLAFFAFIGLFDSVYVGPNYLLCVFGCFASIGSCLRSPRSEAVLTLEEP